MCVRPHVPWHEAHAWWETSTKRVACRCPDCECKGFKYVNGHGTWWIKCECKHGHDDHRSNGVMAGPMVSIHTTTTTTFA